MPVRVAVLALLLSIVIPFRAIAQDATPDATDATPVTRITVEPKAIKTAEDRQLFKETMIGIGVAVGLCLSCAVTGKSRRDDLRWQVS